MAAPANDHDLATVHEIVERRGGFGHPEHLELAWSYLDAYPLEAAKRRMSAAIRHLAAVHGAQDRYYDTITRAWVHLVAVHMSRGHGASFDEFIAGNRGLLDRHLLDRHYSSELLWSERARRRWTEPNLLRLPALA